MLSLLSQLLEDLDLHLVHPVLDSSHHLVEQLDCTVLLLVPVLRSTSTSTLVVLVEPVLEVLVLEALVLEDLCLTES